MRARELVARLRARLELLDVRGNLERVVARPASLSSACTDSLCFLEAPTIGAVQELARRRVSVALCGGPISAPSDSDMVIVVVPEVRLAFAYLSGLLDSLSRESAHRPTSLEGVDSAAVVGPGCYIGPNCTVGPRTVLFPGATLVRNVSIGTDCIIHSGVVIGADGFSYERWPDGSLEKIRHFGRVVIEDDVEIGPNTNVSLGTLDTTRIREGSKIDALCHIGHNADVGPWALIAAGTVMGRSRIGEEAWTGMQSCILPGKNVAARSTVGASALVTKDVTEGQTVAGVPARPLDRVRGTKW